MQIDLFLTLLILGIGLIGTIIVLLYYIFVQKPEIKRELKVNRKKILEFLQNTQITRIELEKIGKTIEIEEFTVRDILLDFAREGSLPGLLVFPNLYYDFQYCVDAVHSLADELASNEIPLKRIAKELETTQHNTNKILIELVSNQGLQGQIDFIKEVFLLLKDQLERKELLCPFCNSEIPPSTNSCPNCNAQLKKCGVCNLVIGNEKSIHCPFCHHPSHSDHLLEWLKIKGKCPVCKHKLSETLLEEEYD